MGQTDDTEELARLRDALKAHFAFLAEEYEDWAHDDDRASCERARGIETAAENLRDTLGFTPATLREFLGQEAYDPSAGTIQELDAARITSQSFPMSGETRPWQVRQA